MDETHRSITDTVNTAGKTCQSALGAILCKETSKTLTKEYLLPPDEIWDTERHDFLLQTFEERRETLKRLLEDVRKDPEDIIEHHLRQIRISHCKAAFPRDVC